MIYPEIDRRPGRGLPALLGAAALAQTGGDAQRRPNAGVQALVLDGAGAARLDRRSRTSPPCARA